MWVADPVGCLQPVYLQKATNLGISFTYSHIIKEAFLCVCVCARVDAKNLGGLSVSIRIMM